VEGLGAFVLNNRIFDIWVLFFFGLIGYFLTKHDFDLPPFVLGFLLEPIAEINLKRALQTSSDPTLFLTRPASGIFILLAVASVLYYFWTGYRRTQQELPQPAEASVGVEH
ncbi:MAG: tripartite tricarboxylate transporter permease, partial [Chloroflexi bacterium]|nr:tripartite tricarboxylate transporter permease [Chloroflexota bacterium]